MNDFSRKFALILLPLCMWASTGYSQDEEGRRFENVETTKVKAMSAATAKLVQPARACLAPEAEREGGPVPDADPRCAIRALDKIRLNDLPGNEKADIWELYGYSYYLLEDEAKSMDYFSQIVSERETNPPLRNRTLKTLAQLHMGREEYQPALDYYLDWMAIQSQLGAPDFYFLAAIYYSMENFNKALENIETAIDMRRDTGKLGEESWYGIQKSIYYDRGDYRKVVSILDVLINNFPNVRYWRELGGMYSELERPRDQLGAYQIAHLQDGLTSSSQVVSLAYMYLSAEVPYKAAKILIEGIEEGDIDDTEKNMQLIGQSLYQAAELQQALPWMEKAARKATDGESYSTLASIYVDLERYSDAIRTAEEALRLGSLKREDLVRMTKGNAEFNLKRYDEALKSFREIKDSRSRDAATDWISYVEAEKKRDRQLRDSGINLDKIRAS